MNCIIIEDQPPAQRILKKYIHDIGSLNLVGTFSNAIEAMEFLKSEQVELIFLDIHLPKISGIDFLKMNQNPPNVILTTAYPDYALESYELNVIDYLLKPFSFKRFVQAVAKLSRTNTSTKDMSSLDKNLHDRKEIFIKSGYDHIKVSVDDIIYIKSDADYTEIHTVNKKHLSSYPLRHWLEILHEDLFFRTHKSYIINTSKIVKISGQQVYLINDFVLPLGRAYKEAFTQKFLK
jgi:DNA-binding LytR/AlgR family response regulator